MIDKTRANLLFRRFGIRFFPALGRRMALKGTAALFEPNTQHPPAALMPLGAYSYAQSHVDEVVSVGRYCSIGRNLSVIARVHPTDWVSSSPVFYREKRFGYWTGQAPDRPLPAFRDQLPGVEIGHDVWIGDNVAIKGGCRIGTGAVIGHGAVVTRDVAPYAIVGGVPAKVIRYRFDAPLREALLASAWWRFGPEDLHRMPMTDPRAFLDGLAAMQGSLPPREEARHTLSHYLEKAESADVP